MRKLAIATTAIAMILGAGAASVDQDRGRREQSNQQTAFKLRAEIVERSPS